MTKLELLDMLTEYARDFRSDSGHYTRNGHLHRSLTQPPTQPQIDAVLVGFINYVGVAQGVDYALHDYHLLLNPPA
jgi:hypothetical protein